MKIGPQVWISCRISDGMFSNEYGVEILLPSGEGVSLYVDKSLVRGSGDKAELLVTVVDNGHPGEERTVVLPNESLQGSRWVRVIAQQRIERGMSGSAIKAFCDCCKVRFAKW